MTATDRRHALQVIGGSVVAAGAAQSLAAQSTGKRRIKVGQIGVGHAHATKLSVYRASNDYEVVGIVEPDPQLRARATQEPVYQDLPWMTHEQLLNVPGLEVVLVETRVADLLDTAETCVAAGKHIHLDKPAGASLSQFRRLLDAAASQNLLVQMGFMYRYNPAVVLLRECLQRGWLGEPFEIHAVMSKVISPASREKLQEFAGGTMFELGCHLIDLVVAMMGKPDNIAAYPRQVIKTDRFNDNMLAVLEYPNATATIKSSGVEVNGFARRHLVVCGTEGAIHIQPLDDPAARVAFSQERGKYQRGYQDVAFPTYTRYVEDAADMARVLRGEKASDFSYAHDLTVQTAVLQACEMPQDS